MRRAPNVDSRSGFETNNLIDAAVGVYLKPEEILFADPRSTPVELILEDLQSRADIDGYWTRCPDRLHRAAR
jgi:hypothetical protein